VSQVSTKKKVTRKQITASSIHVDDYIKAIIDAGLYCQKFATITEGDKK